MIRSLLARQVLTALVLITVAVRSEGAPSFTDDFSQDHDFLARGVDGSDWDGFLGKGPRETVDRLEIADGKLQVQSTHGRYQEGWNPLGPLLYKTVTGDFKATVRVVDYQSVSFNNCGIMARVASLGDAGEGEDWISVDYFPIYGGIYGRMADDNRRHEKVNNGQGRKADKYLQLELLGNMVFLRHSPDGVTWNDLPNTPILRNDLVNVPLQVGLFQATYSGNQGHVSFDDFRLEIGDQVKTARLHYPEDGLSGTPTVLTLSWVPGSGAGYHDVYFADSRQAVEAAHAKMSAGTGAYKGRQEVTDLTCEVSGLQDGTTYYWRIDEVAGDQIHRGGIWSFTVYDRNVASFEDYGSTDALSTAWAAGGTAVIALASAGSLSGSKSLKLTYDNTATPYHAQAEFTFAKNQDWLSSYYSFRVLRVHFKGDARNTGDELFMIFEDNDWGARRTVVKYDGDPAALRTPTWTRWDIDLRRLVANNPSFRLAHVKKMGFAMGHPDAASAGGSGVIHFDAVSLQYRLESDSGASWPRYIQPERFVRPVPFGKVKVTGGLWRERMDVNRTVSLPHVWGRCENSKKANGQESKRLDNFRKVAGEMEGSFTGTYFNDSDVYKIIQGTAYSLQNHPDPELETYTDNVIASIAGAQWDDGYLYTFYSLPEKKPSARWTNVRSMHELYCAGHLFEGAVAYYKATGKRKLLDVAIRFADLICDTFGPGKKGDPPGHQEIELALIKLYEVTGSQKYMDMAKFFIDQRGQGQGRDLYGTYSQDHARFVEQEKGTGHSVRAGYLYCAAVDVAQWNHDEAYGNTSLRLWDNISSTKTYLTGGIGQPGGPEGFTNDYELGNSCYAETCSGIAFAMWNHRLHQLTGESKYLDIMERTLLNNMLSSLSAKGDEHFYTNPLMTNGRERWEWPGHDCACCPSNLVRVITSVSGYAYSHGDNFINVNMYLQSEGIISLPKNSVTLTQTTRYPWDEEITITVRPESTGRFSIRLRIPGWAQNTPLPGNLYKYLDKSSEQVKVSVNEAPVEIVTEQGYVTLDRRWQANDTIHLVLPMPIRRVVAHPKVTADAGLVAVERGPMVYCAEFADNPMDVADLRLPDTATLKATFEKDFFNGVVTLTSARSPRLKLIPYYLYANRGRGWMRVWMLRK